MKIVVIGDIHGRTIRKDIVAKETDADRIIFMGDYFDSFDISIGVQFKNFEEIVAYKKSNPDKVTLLIWNHDAHYLPGFEQEYSGFNAITKVYLFDVLYNLITDWTIKLITREPNYLFSHAGISKDWLNLIRKGDQEILLVELDNTWVHQLHNLCYNPKDKSGFGDNPNQWPLWIRPKALVQSPLDWWTQVVWHTQQEHIKIRDDLILVDTLHNREYLVIEDWVPRIETI